MSGPRTPQTMTSTSAATSTLFLGQSGAQWDVLVIASLGVAIFAACLVAAATGGSVVSHKREARAAESALEGYKLETAGKVADASKAGIAAGEAASSAHLLAAEANERAATADLKRVELEASIAPRRLGPAQRHVMALMLRPFAGSTVSVATYTGDVESKVFAASFIEALRSGGINIVDKRATVQSFGNIVFGVHATGANQPLVRALVEATGKAAHDGVGNHPSAGGGAMIRYEVVGPATDAEVMIGPKPPK